MLAEAFGGTGVVGKRFVLGRDTCEISGVVSDAVYMNLKEERMQMVYFPARTMYGATFEVRAAGNALTHAAAVRQIVRDADFRIAIFDVETQRDHINQLMSQEITLSRLCTAFALPALMIAGVGVYGTV